VKEAAKSIEQQVARLVRLGGTLCWPVLYAAAVGYTAWWWRHRSVAQALAKNKMAHELRMQMLAWMGYAAVGLAVVYLVAIVVDSLAVRSVRVHVMVGELNRRLAGLCAMPFVVSLTPEGVESSDPIWTVLMAAAAATTVAISAFFWRKPTDIDAADDPEHEGLLRRVGRWAAPLAAVTIVLALGVAYGYLLSRLAIANHHALHTRTIDLGYYDNIFYNSIHGRPLGCSMVKGGTHASAHFDPILILLSPLYLLYPRAEMLLVLQSVWLGIGVVPAYLLGSRTLDSRPAGVVMAFAWVLYPGLQGANLYEFHSLTLIGPLVLFLFFFLEEKKWIGYGITLVLLLLCREDVPLMLCVVGLYAVISGRAGIARAGAITIVFCIAYYLVARSFFMPAKDLLNSSSEKAYSYAYYFDDLIPNKKGVGDLALSLITNPMFVIRHAFADQQKVLFLLVLFVPLGALPLLARRARITLIYGLLVCMLASRKPVFQIGFQYAAMIFSFAFAIVPRAIRDLMNDSRVRGMGLDPDGVRRAALAFITVASMVVSWKFGALVENTAFRGGFGRIARLPLTEAQQKEYAELRSLVDLIEPGASVVVTNRIGAHVTNRQHVYFFSTVPLTDYVLADETELGRNKNWIDKWISEGVMIEHKRVGRLVLWKATVPARLK
jgi:uncharacterized membrane protein